MSENSILHLLVIGFHHKKGCQVEFIYPPIDPDNAESTELPDMWKNLPSLALPDGSHNFDQDIIFFHLPSLENPKHTVFGVSCFRQINAESLLRKSSDVTRSSVQKSVCVLSRLPLYGVIQSKLEVITQAYFAERDFSQVALLRETFATLNTTLSDHLLLGSQAFYGLSVRDLITRFRHKVLVLFKLLLLEKKVLFFKSPVKELCITILTICSLFPGMLEKDGLLEAGCQLNVQNSRISPEPMELDSTAATVAPKPPPLPINNSNMSEFSAVADDLSDEDDALLLEIDSLLSAPIPPDAATLKVHSSSPVVVPEELEDLGLPLAIFTKGSICHPYLSLPYLDCLSDINVRSFVVGATNVLFRQKAFLFDVIVEMESGLVEISDPELRRQLHLSTEDLRFADHLVRIVTDSQELSQNDGTRWEGGEEWLRSQFRLYLLSLLRISQLEAGAKETEAFNSQFLAAWKTTHNYKIWSAQTHKGLEEVYPSHPFQGHLNVSDMKIRLAHSIQTSEKGRKLNQAMQSTGRAFGGALVSAKSAVSSWWTHLNGDAMS